MRRHMVHDGADIAPESGILGCVLATRTWIVNLSESRIGVLTKLVEFFVSPVWAQDAYLADTYHELDNVMCLYLF